MNDLQKFVLIAVAIILMTNTVKTNKEKFSAEKTYTLRELVKIKKISGTMKSEDLNKNVRITTIWDNDTYGIKIGDRTYTLPKSDIEKTGFMDNLINSFNEKLPFWITIGILFLGFIIGLFI